jgi:hypothetical protein
VRAQRNSCKLRILWKNSKWLPSEFISQPKHDF